VLGGIADEDLARRSSLGLLIWEERRPAHVAQAELCLASPDDPQAAPRFSDPS
jgi:hypothetical protein